MERYEVLIELSAERDLLGILTYISETLKEPETAFRIYSAIKEQIESLRMMALRCKLVNDELYSSRGVRRLSAENYSIFYIVDREKREVHVFRILCNRREWQSLLDS